MPSYSATSTQLPPWVPEELDVRQASSLLLIKFTPYLAYQVQGFRRGQRGRAYQAHHRRELGYLVALLDDPPAAIALCVADCGILGELIYGDCPICPGVVVCPEREHLYDDAREARSLDQPVELGTHHRRPADRVPQRPLIDHVPGQRGLAAREDALTFHTGGDELGYRAVAVFRSARAHVRPGVVFGLEQAGDGAELPAMDADGLALERDHRREEGGVSLARHQLIEGHEGPGMPGSSLKPGVWNALSHAAAKSAVGGLSMLSTPLMSDA